MNTGNTITTTRSLKRIIAGCGLGLLVAGPVATIAVTYAYRTLTGGTVSAQ